MQQSTDKYFPQLENQGINPVGDNAQITNTCTIQINPRNQRDKGLSIPSRSLTRVRSDRYDKIILLVFYDKDVK